MKTLIHKATALLLVFGLVLGMAACGEAPAKTDAAAEPAGTKADAATESTQVPVTEEPATEAPTAEEPATEAPTTEAQTDLSGYYLLVSLPTDGGEENVKQYFDLGYYAFIVLESEGKGYLHLFGQEDEVTWDAKTIKYLRTAFPFELKDDGTLTLYQNSKEYMIFRRSEAQTPKRGEATKAMLGLYRTEEITLKDVTLINTEEYSIVANEIVVPSGMTDDYVIRTTITNKTINDRLNFSASYAVINGISVPISPNRSGSSAKLGESQKCDFAIALNDLKDAGTGDPTEIRLYLQIKPQYDPQNRFLDYVTIYPLGEDKAESAMHKGEENDQVIEDNSSAKLTFTGLKDKLSGYKIVTFWAENKTDQPTRAFVLISAVNGMNCTFAGEAFIAPHSSGILKVFMNNDRLNELGVDQITDLSFTFQLSTDSVNSQSITQGDYRITP